MVKMSCYGSQQNSGRKWSDMMLDFIIHIDPQQLMAVPDKIISYLCRRVEIYVGMLTKRAGDFC